MMMTLSLATNSRISKECNKLLILISWWVVCAQQADLWMYKYNSNHSPISFQDVYTVRVDAQQIDLKV
jgi:hypothetical protein